MASTARRVCSSVCRATTGSAPFSGCYKPEGLLSTVANQSSSGNWTLTVTDDTGSDTGTLNSWNLVLCTTP